MNLAHETDLLLLDETTVIDETGATLPVVFPLVIIEAFDDDASPPPRILRPDQVTVRRDYFSWKRKLRLKTAVRLP
jgi:hypothetical protein